MPAPSTPVPVAVPVRAAPARRRPVPARLGDAAGQGTVEYVALVLLVAGVLASAVAFGGTGFKDGKLTKTIVTQIEESIAKVSGGR